MRRSVIAFIGVVLVLIVGMIPVAAQEGATPESGLADLGLPTLDVTVTAAGYEGIPESLEAGRYLVTLTASDDVGEFGGGVAFIQPSGMTADEFLGLLSGPPDESGVGAVPSTPIDEANATPAEGGEGMGGPPPAVFESHYAGGTYAGPGQSAEVVLDLRPGEWIAWADDPEAAQEPVIFDVTGEMPADLAEPESSATLTMGEYVIAVTEGELTAGQHILKVENLGAQPHFIAGGHTTVDVTEADIEAVLESEMTGTPAAVDFNPDEDFEESFYTATQSTGTAIWVPVDLEAGTQVLICFFPDIADGMPHAFKGMYTIIEVGE